MQPMEMRDYDGVASIPMAEEVPLQNKTRRYIGFGALLFLGLVGAVVMMSGSNTESAPTAATDLAYGTIITASSTYCTGSDMHYLGSSRCQLTTDRDYQVLSVSSTYCTGSDFKYMGSSKCLYFGYGDTPNIMGVSSTYCKPPGMKYLGSNRCLLTSDEDYQILTASWNYCSGGKFRYLGNSKCMYTGGYGGTPKIITVSSTYCGGPDMQYLGNSKCLLTTERDYNIMSVSSTYCTGALMRYIGNGKCMQFTDHYSGNSGSYSGGSSTRRRRRRRRDSATTTTELPYRNRKKWQIYGFRNKYDCCNSFRLMRNAAACNSRCN